MPLWLILSAFRIVEHGKKLAVPQTHDQKVRNANGPNKELIPGHHILWLTTITSRPKLRCRCSRGSGETTWLLWLPREWKKWRKGQNGSSVRQKIMLYAKRAISSAWSYRR